MLTLGGDHTIALPLLRALAAAHGPVAVVHFDAHLDTWDTYFGAAYTHGTPFRRASEEGLLDRSGCLHVGIRGPLYTGSDLTDDARARLRRSSPRRTSTSSACAGIVERIRHRVGDRPVYVSVDIDVLDPAHAPGTGTPEAGGLTSRELLAALRVFARLNLVGADVVEVAPAYDHAEITGIAAAHVGLRAAASGRPEGGLRNRRPVPIPGQRGTGGSLRGRGRAVGEVLERFDLAGFADRRSGRYSGGQRPRLGGVLLPISLGPGWMRVLAHLNPLYYAVSAARAWRPAPSRGSAVWQAFAVLTPLCAVVMSWATAVVRRAVA